MKLITVQLNDGNEIHGHVQSERDISDGVRLTCVDEEGFLFNVILQENDDEPLDQLLTKAQGCANMGHQLGEHK